MAPSSIPVFQVVIGTVALIAAFGVTFAVVPALRNRRWLVTAWVLSVCMVSLAVLANLVRLMHELS